MARVAVLELPARFARQEEAAREAGRLIGRAPCDLAVLPECALTGYVSPRGAFDLSRFAEPLAQSSQLRALRDLAASGSCHVAGPIIESDGARAYNAYAVVSPSGDLLASYRKRHPWYPETWATPGAAPPPMFTLCDITFTIAICFDVHFVDRDAAGELEASDALLFPSAWVDDDDTDLRAGIFERVRRRYGVTVVNANWGPGAPRVRGQGGSRVVLADGGIRMIEQGTGARRLDVELLSA